MALAAQSIFQTPRFTPAISGVFGTNTRPPVVTGIGQALTMPDAPVENNDNGDGGRGMGKSGLSSPSNTGESLGSAVGNAMGKATESYASMIGKAANVVNAVGKVGTLPALGIKAVAAVVGAAIDTAQANQTLNNLGLPNFAFTQWGKAVVEALSPVNLGWSIEQQLTQAIEASWNSPGFAGVTGGNVGDTFSAGPSGPSEAVPGFEPDPFSRDVTVDPAPDPDPDPDPAPDPDPDPDPGVDPGTDESTDEGDDDDDGSGEGDG